MEATNVSIYQSHRYICILIYNLNFLEAISELATKLKQLQIANQKLERNSRGSVFESVHDQKVNTKGTEYSAAGDSEALVEETTLIRLQQGNSVGISVASSSASSNLDASPDTLTSGSTACSVNLCAMFLLVLLVIKTKIVNL